MYISIKLPPEFGSFNRLRKENYPFNKLFTGFLKEVSKLGLSRHIDVEELVGYIEDRIFDGQRVPDIPYGDEPVNVRYKTDDPDVVEYIGGSDLNNRMAVLYITRMMLRMSAAYGTSLFRLTRVIRDLDIPAKPKRAVEPKAAAEQPLPKPRKTYVKPAAAEPDEEEDEMGEEPAKMPGVRLSGRAAEAAEPESKAPTSSSASESAQKAKAALSELESLTEKADVVETNPFLSQFGGVS